MTQVRWRPAAAPAWAARLSRLSATTRALFARRLLPRPAARVNPLAFLSGTALRFVTLAVVALATTWDAWQVIAGTLLGSQYRTAVDRCLEGIATTIQVNDAYIPQATGSATEQSSLVAYAARSCTNPYSSASTTIALTAVAVLAAGTFALFWCWPAWSIRRRRLIPVPRQHLAALDAEITALVAASRVRQVEFLLDAADPRVAGRAFGRPGRRYVVLSRGLTVLYGADPGAVRAVIAHELGHLRNRDVDPGYAAVWTWRVFMAVTIVPMAVWVSWSVAGGQGGTAMAYGWRVVAAAVLAMLVRGWLFRSRECLADARAFADGVHEITDLLSLPQPAVHRKRLGEWLSLHPTPRQRAGLLADPRRLMKTGFWESFAVGAIAMLANDVADVIAAVCRVYSTATTYVGTTGTIMVVTWSVSQSALRTALARRFDDKKKFYQPLKKLSQRQIDTASLVYLAPGIRVSLGMSLGLVSGRFIAISPIASIDVGHTADGIFVVFMRWGLWAFFASFFIVSWCFLAAHTWIPVIAQATRPRRATLAAAAVCCSVMSPLLLRLMTNYYLYENLPWERAGVPGAAAASIAFSYPNFGYSRDGALWALTALIVLVILGTLVLIPQARRNSRVPCEWVTLDPPIRVPWHKPAITRGIALILSFYAAAAGTINPTLNPGTWLGLNITSMALSPTSPTHREVTRANPNLDDPLTGGQVYENLCEGYFGGGTEFDASISHQDLVIYSSDGIAWWRAYVLALPGDRVTSAGGGAPILIDGDQIDGRIPGNEETTSLQPLHLQVPPGKLWVTGLHWNLAAPGVYHLGEPGGGLINRNWVIAFEPHADIGALDWSATAPCGGA